MRLYVSADIEGIPGVVSPESGRVGGFDHDWACNAMTDSVLAVCTAARDLGVEEVIVSDSHGNGQSIRHERLPDFVQLIRSWPRPLGMMQGIEAGPFAGAVLLGYHAGAGSLRGLLAHTMSSEFIHEIRLNSQVASEARISAALAGEFGVPIVMVVGDDVTVAETSAFLPDAATATTKISYGSRSAMSPSPTVSNARITQALRIALERRERIAPLRIVGPVELQIRLRTSFVAEWLGYMPTVERIDGFTIRYHAADMKDVSRFLMFIAFARSALA